MARPIRNEHNSFYLLVLLAFFLLFSYQVQAEVRCEDRILATTFGVNSSPDHFLGSFKELPSYWQRPGAVKMFTRSWNDEAVMTIAAGVARLPREVECMTVNETTEACFKASVSSDGKVLSISIPVISVGGNVSLGFRPQTLNMEFLKIISGILRGAEFIKNQEPGIKHLEIHGLTTVNPTLASMLTRLGFEPIGLPSLEGGADYKVEASFW